MTDSDSAPDFRGEVLDTWIAPIEAGNAAEAVHQFGKAWMTLSIVQLIVALYCYLLPSLPLGASGLPLRHVLYAPALFAMGYLYEYFKSRIIAVVLLLAIIGETGWYAYSITQMIQADVVWAQVAIAIVWRALLAWLALRSIKAAFLA